MVSPQQPRSTTPDRSHFKQVTKAEMDQIIESIEWDKAPKAIHKPGTKLEREASFIQLSDLFSEPTTINCDASSGVLDLDMPIEGIVTKFNDGSFGFWPSKDEITPLEDISCTYEASKFRDKLKAQPWSEAKSMSLNSYLVKVIPLSSIFGSEPFRIIRSRVNSVGGSHLTYDNPTQLSAVKVESAPTRIRIVKNSELTER